MSTLKTHHASNPRGASSCKYCRRRKIKCSGSRPRCDTCVGLSKTDCAYDMPPPDSDIARVVCKPCAQQKTGGCDKKLPTCGICSSKGRKCEWGDTALSSNDLEPPVSHFTISSPLPFPPSPNHCNRGPMTERLSSAGKLSVSSKGPERNA